MFVFLQKQYHKNFAFLILRIAELFAHEVCNFLKTRQFLTYSIVSECLQTNFSHISCAHISKNKKCFNVKFSTYYFHMKTKILADFQICISVPLKHVYKQCSLFCLFCFGLELLIKMQKSWFLRLQKPGLFKFLQISNTILWLLVGRKSDQISSTKKIQLSSWSSSKFSIFQTKNLVSRKQQSFV